MTTGNDLITDALQEINVLPISGTAKSNMANHALNKGNRMLSGWANQGRKVYQIFNETQTLSASTQDYTIGSGATWDTDWPTKILSIKIRTSNNYDYNTQEYSNNQWQSITDKSTETDIPRYWRYNRAFPQGTISFYPIPNGTLTALISSLKQFTAMTLAGTVNLPPGYEEFFVLSLAKRIAPTYGATLSREFNQNLWDAEQGISAVNKKNEPRSVDNALISNGGMYDINTGTYL